MEFWEKWWNYRFIKEWDISWPTERLLASQVFRVMNLSFVKTEIYKNKTDANRLCRLRTSWNLCFEIFNSEISASLHTNESHSTLLPDYWTFPTVTTDGFGIFWSRIGRKRIPLKKFPLVSLASTTSRYKLHASSKHTKSLSKILHGF
jgi:hypothetical protein